MHAFIPINAHRAVRGEIAICQKEGGGGERVGAVK